jgi:hypothetical protein
MATKKKPGKKKAPAKGATPKADPKQAREKSALKGMAIGAVICAALAAFFMLRIGGATPFDHLVKALGGGDDAAKKPAAAAAPAQHSEATPARRPVIARTAATAKPMEKVSGGDQQALGELIRARSK